MIRYLRPQQSACMVHSAKAFFVVAMIGWWCCMVHFLACFVMCKRRLRDGRSLGVAGRILKRGALVLRGTFFCFSACNKREHVLAATSHVPHTCMRGGFCASFFFVHLWDKKRAIIGNGPIKMKPQKKKTRIITRTILQRTNTVMIWDTVSIREYTASTQTKNTSYLVRAVRRLRPRSTSCQQPLGHDRQARTNASIRKSVPTKSWREPTRQRRSLRRLLRRREVRRARASVGQRRR